MRIFNQCHRFPLANLTLAAFLVAWVAACGDATVAIMAASSGEGDGSTPGDIMTGDGGEGLDEAGDGAREEWAVPDASPGDADAPGESPDAARPDTPDAGEPDPEEPLPLEGCADPANEGLPCAGEVVHACGVYRCQDGACAALPIEGGTPCRPIAGDCDVAEACDGARLDCPDDTFVPNGMICRGSADICDAPEYCTGISPHCPANAFFASTTVCRASSGGCDQTEYCTDASPTCPGDGFDSSCTCPKDGPISGYEEHDGLRKIDATRFMLRDTGTWDKYTALVDGLGLTAVPLGDLPLNRKMTAMGTKNWVGFKKGWFWTSGDRSVSYWIPQGLGGGTTEGKTFRVVGWHYDEGNNAADTSQAVDESDLDKGARVSFVETTDASNVNYRHVLLVEPTSANGRGFKPIKNHVGGIAWTWPYLYVADTSRGIRAFDMRRILRVSAAEECDSRAGRHGSVYCAYGYGYVLPQVGGYYFPSGMNGSCKPKFSYIALDRGGGKTSILSGEYFNETGSNIYGRLLRWPMGSGGRLSTDENGIVQASGAWYAGNRNIQGAVSHGSGSNPTFLLNATRYNGALFTGKAGAASKVFKASEGKWAYMPEGMYITTAGNLWVSTEGHANLDRCIFYADVDSIL